ncbi:MAG: mismatch repair protein MutL [Myxococcaceae bacterium]|nr:mismatch repair protein MutL [Myxococcaceae bacterium]MEA2746154.1 mismatch repair protein MutL [Myxococcales bacterium]
MGRIKRLSGELANQIAAGEVVERPSSVVKELVENALDAGATRVVVDVEQGGTTLVRVCDDGEGMTPDDALLCLERHATSKISRFTDLSDLGTFGFRGEALPSIASVSRLSLRTRPRGSDEGLEVVVAGGGPPSVAPTGAAIGTTIEVRDLFFNVPARRKFLKATATESAHVSDVLLGMALARYDVTFVLTRDGRPVREHLRAASRAERARAVMSSDGASLVECRSERGAVRIEAMLAPPERARSGATGLSILVNGRPVRDRQLVRAVAQAYGSVLESGRYPLGVVWIDVPPEVVDVNVHPQKAEVRFSDARGLFDAVTRELHDALAHAFGLPALGAHSQAPVFRPQVPTLRALESHAQAALAAMRTIVEPPDRALMPEGNLFGMLADGTAASPPFRAEAPASGPPNEAGGYGSLRYVGQVRGTFLVCEGSDGLYVLDQHAAAERVTFDRLRRSYAARGVAMQRLLVPELVELSPSEVAMLEENAEEVSRLGVEVRAVGDNAVAVHGVPDLLVRADPTRLVRDLVAEVSRTAGRPFRGAIDLVLATMACHGSVRAGDAISPTEVTALLRALDDVDFGGHCPHGRPLVMRMPFGELERRVGR